MEMKPFREIGRSFVATDWPVIMAFAENKNLSAEEVDILAACCQGFAKEMKLGTDLLSIAPVNQE